MSAQLTEKIELAHINHLHFTSSPADRPTLAVLAAS
jgi:hypothetical protein